VYAPAGDRARRGIRAVGEGEDRPPQSCPSCGTENAAGRTWCVKCGHELPEQTAASGSTSNPANSGWWAQIEPVKIGQARYVTQRAGTKAMSTGTIKIGADGIRWHGFYRFPKVEIAWPDLQEIMVDGESLQKVSVGAVATFGVLGLGAKKRRTMTRLAFVTTTGEHAFEIDRTDPSAIRNRLRPVTDAMPAQAQTAPANPPVVVSIADELAKLGALRDQGLLSPDEFEVQKGRLLS
jgi:hypothetical protein